MNHSLFGYEGGNSWIYRLSGSTKLIYFLALSITSMVSYDLRYIAFLFVISMILFQQAHIKWRRISLVVKLITFFTVFNLIVTFLFSPNHGTALYGTRHVILEAGFFSVTQEELFYMATLASKFLVAIPLALIFLLTTNPSEFASSLNKIGLSYRISYAFSLALRYIPDIQQKYREISMSQRARGFKISGKGKLIPKIKEATHVVMPLIFSSLNQIDTISQAMELRRFGIKRRRTWYLGQPLHTLDYVSLAVIVILVALGIGLMFIDGGRFYNPFM